MKFPNYFADAESNYKDSEFVIFGVPYDKTSSFRSGAKEGPKAIRQASWNFETFNFKTGVDLKNINFHDYGDLNVTDNSPKVMVEKVKYFTKKLLLVNKIPLCLGGEHSITSGIIQAYPKEISVICLDAHIDFREKYEDNKYNHACVNRRISEHIGVENLAVLGIRSAEKKEFEDAKKQNLFYVDSNEIKQNGIKNALKNSFSNFKYKKFYLTIDIDVLDPAYAPGTGTPEPFGLTPSDIVECIDFLSSNLIGFDIVEVCPPFDKGETAITAAKIVRYAIEKIWSGKQR
ncbi:MAG: agmatinase [Thermoplasmatales archaeon]|nr:MAG: agmatinase [Thermoplasmatales archaeon]